MRRPPEVQNRGRTPEVRVREDVETERRWRLAKKFSKDSSSRRRCRRRRESGEILDK